VFGPLADQFSVESLLIAAGIIMFLVVAVATTIPAGRRSMAAAGAATTRPLTPEAVEADAAEPDAAAEAAPPSQQ